MYYYFNLNAVATTGMFAAVQFRGARGGVEMHNVQGTYILELDRADPLIPYPYSTPFLACA